MGLIKFSLPREMMHTDIVRYYQYSFIDRAVQSIEILGVTDNGHQERGNDFFHWYRQTPPSLTSSAYHSPPRPVEVAPTLPSFPSPLHSSLSSPRPDLSIRIRPLKSSYWVWGSAVISPAGYMSELQPKSNLVHFNFKICHLMAGCAIGLQYAAEKYL